MMNLIGIVGKKRSGKDTFASVLIERGWKRAAFADALKAEVAEWVGVSVENLELRKEAFRATLQERGAKMRREDPEYWIKKLVATIAEDFTAGTRVVITDVRYENEAAWIGANDGILVKMVRAGAPDDDEHPSEREQDRIDANKTHTCSSPEEVRQRAVEFIEDA